MMNSRFLLLIVFISSAHYSQAKVWIKSPKTSFLDFKTHIIKQDSDKNSSYEDYFLKKKREESKSFQLKDKIIESQKLYLSGEMDLALKSFKEITHLAYKADWDKEDRRIIFYSYLRRIQHETDKRTREALLFSASQFISSQITKDYPDHHLFPPPLIKELNQFQKKETFLILNFKKIFPYHKTILINGKQIQTDSPTQIANGSYRITALSSSHAPWSKIISLSYLASQSIKTKTLTSGYCENLKIKPQWIEKDIKVFIPKNCKKINFMQKTQNIKTTTKKEKIDTQDSSKDKSFFENIPTWAIVAGAVVVTGILFSLTKESKDSNKNTFSY